MNIRPIEKHHAGKWISSGNPRRILIVRMQAIGDVALTFPLVQALKNQYPDMEIDFLTRHIQGELSKNLTAIHKVIAITNSQRIWRQTLDIALRMPYLISRKYDVIIDLQYNKPSCGLRRLLRPIAWAEFDRKGLEPAIVRYRNAVEASGLKISSQYPDLNLTNPLAGNQLLLKNDWDGKSALVVLNPGGLFKSRNWPIENYVGFAKQWLSLAPETQFLMMGDKRIESKAGFLKEQLGNRLINLYQKTTLEEAFSILSQVKFMISEDSGLYWMAWVQKVPSIAMFGSTPGSRMNMGGSHARFLTSTDLPCGDCFLPACKFGETALCLSRYTPQAMIALAQEIIGPELSKPCINQQIINQQS